MRPIARDRPIKPSIAHRHFSAIQSTLARCLIALALTYDIHR
jgi:hypothetical protein